MKTLERESGRFSEIVKKHGRLSREAREQIQVCNALQIIVDLKKNLVMDESGFFAKLHDEEIFDRVMNFN